MYMHVTHNKMPSWWRAKNNLHDDEWSSLILADPHHVQSHYRCHWSRVPFKTYVRVPFKTYVRAPLIEISCTIYRHMWNIYRHVHSFSLYVKFAGEPKTRNGEGSSYPLDVLGHKVMCICRKRVGRDQIPKINHLLVLKRKKTKKKALSCALSHSRPFVLN